MSPFLHYDYMRFVKTSVTWFKPFFSRIACVTPGCSDEVLMICPMKLRIDGKYYTLLGDMQGCDIADVLWKRGLSEEEKKAITRYFFDSMKDKMFLNRIPEESPFAAGVPTERISYTRDVEYVAIDIPKDYDAYFKTLSPSVRQNIRTAYNRMKRNEIPFEFRFIPDNRKLSSRCWTSLLHLYADRMINKKKKENALLTRLRFRLFLRFKHDTHSLRKKNGAVSAVLFSGEQLMAFFSGFLTHSGTILVVPRLAINEAFRFYSPGYILMNETIQYLGQNTDIRVLDMSRGDERYKKDFGGRSYFIKDFVVEKA